MSSKSIATVDVFERSIEIRAMNSVTPFEAVP